MKILSIFFLFVLTSAFADVIPTSRIAAWAGNVGVEGGIPNSANMPISTALTAGQVSAAAINSAIASCPSGSVVTLPAGTFNIAGNIVFDHKNGVVLRGAGSGATFLNLNNSGDGGIIFYGDYPQGVSWPTYSPNGVVNWVGGYAQGGSNLTFSSVSGLSVAMVICLDMVDHAQMVNWGSEGPCQNCTRPGRAIEQWVEVKAINGTTVTVWPPIAHSDWSSASSPQAWWMNNAIKRSGLEDMHIDRSNGGGNGQYSPNIYMRYSWNCWIKNVKSVHPATTSFSTHLNPFWGGRLEVRHCWFDKTGTTSAIGAYGYLPWQVSSCLIEDNIFTDLPSPVIMGAANTANAYSYNYLAQNSDTSNLGDSFEPHDIANMYDLLEGNYGSSIQADIRHGPSTAYTTIYRNRFHAQQWRYIPVNSWMTNWYWNAVGNVLGFPNSNPAWRFLAVADPTWTGNAAYEIFSLGGQRSSTLPTVADPQCGATFYYHGNYDTANNGIVFSPTNSDHVIPNSLLYSSKPGWFGNRPWPPFDTANGASLVSNPQAYTNIPAGYRFAFGVDPPGQTSGSTNPVISVSPSSVDVTATNGGVTNIVVTVQNINSNILVGSASLSVTNPFTILGSGVNYSLGPQQSTTFTLRFSQLAQFGVVSTANLIFTGGNGATVPLVGGLPKTYIHCVGDSLTRGGSSAGDTNFVLGGYRLKFYQLMTNAGLNATMLGTLSDNPTNAMPYPNHEGHPGFKIENLAAGYNSYASTIVHAPDYVLLACGLADYEQNNATTTASNRLESLIVQIQTNFPAAKVIVADMNPWDNLGPTNAAMNLFYNPFIPGVVARQAATNGNRVLLADMRQPYMTVSDVMPGDNTQLQPSGYDKMAVSFFGAVTGTNGVPLISVLPSSIVFGP